MSRLFRVLLIASLLAGLAPALPAAAQSDLPPNCQLTPGPNSSELYLICMPQPPAPPWNGDLVVFAHGYVAPDPYGSLEDIFKQLILPDTTLPELANSMGYAFAMTTYSKNGLAVREGLDDTMQLIRTLKQQYPVRYVYLVGASEGGLITTLAAEKYPQTFSGGLALCGPIGDFRGQINYWGDFRVLFDYFFPAYDIPNSPVDINEPLVWPNWEATSQAIGAAVYYGGHTTEQLLRTSHAPIDAADPYSVISTTVGILSYNVFATNEARDELGGQPFGNRYTWYFGSDNDRALNQGVQRFDADPAALREISRHYQTSGRLKVPLVTMHTLGDPIVPYWHETLYNAKALFGGSALKHVNLPIVRYGHCTFTTQEAQYAFALLVRMVTGAAPAGMEEVMPTPEMQQGDVRLFQEYQSLPAYPR